MFPINFNFPFRKSNGELTTIGKMIENAGGGGGSYTLPTASAEVKGGVKIGEGLEMDGEVLKATGGTPYELPTASAEIKGGVKIGSGLTMDGEVLKLGFSPTYGTSIPLINTDSDSDLKAYKMGDTVVLGGAITLTTPLATGERVQIANGGIPSDMRIASGYCPMIVTFADANITKFTIATLTPYANGNMFVNNNFADISAKYIWVNCLYRIAEY